MTAAAHDAYVSESFDRLQARFKDSLRFGDSRLRSLVDFLGPLSGLRVLDLGCGKGRFALELRERGAVVVGLDLSAAMLRTARMTGLPYARGTARRLPFPDGSFDVVIAVEILEHLDEPHEAFLEARRVLVPSGRIAVLDKNAWSLNDRRPWLPNLLLKWIDERRGLWMYPSKGPVRERWFCPAGMRRSMNAHFEDVAVSFPIRPEEERGWLFRKVPGSRLFVLWSARVPGVGVD